MIEKILHRITPYIGFVLFLAAICIVHHELKVHSIADITDGLEQVPMSVILLGTLLTGINYLCLTGYDFMALRYLGRTVRPRNILLASLISFSISNNTGQALISGSSMRYRFYSLWGLSGMDIIKFSLFISLMYVLGATTLFSISTLTSPGLMEASLPLARTVQWLAWSALAALAVYWCIILFRKKPFIIRNMELFLPGPGLSLAQTIIAMTDLIFPRPCGYFFSLFSGCLYCRTDPGTVQSDPRGHRCI